MKAGIESDNTFLHENFSYIITMIPLNSIRARRSPFSFVANRPDLEQSAFVQDLIRLGNWTINAGLRWDHYQLMLNRRRVDPRFAISRYFPSAGLVLHFSYDRVFQTPSFENILLSSSTAAMAIVHVAMKSSASAPPSAAHADYIARTGKYGRRGDVVHVEPGNMPEFAQADRALSGLPPMCTSAPMDAPIQSCKSPCRAS